MSQNRYLVDLSDPTIHEVKSGGKARNLHSLLSFGYNVPTGFVVCGSAFLEHISLRQDEFEEFQKPLYIERRIEIAKSLQRYMRDQQISGLLHDELIDKLSDPKYEAIAVRSSAHNEDGSMSFGGQFDSYLNRNRMQVLEAIPLCWGSFFNRRAAHYMRGAKLDNSYMGVVVQRYIQPNFAGTIFTVNPVDPDDRESLVVEYVEGAGDSLVSGRETPSHIEVDRRTLSFEEEVKDREMIQELAKLGLNIERDFEYPQDIEWCATLETIYIVQTRRITSL